MVTVYFEMRRPLYAEIVAKFADEETYMVCLPALEELCKERGFDIVTESMPNEEDL